MKRIKQAIKICRYQLLVMCNGYKLFVMPVCLIIFMLNGMLPFRKFLKDVGEGASPFLFPFLFSDVILSALIFATALPFFIDAPFYDRQQCYVIVRSEISEWALGQIFYVFLISFMYASFLLILSLVLLIPYISFQAEWGRIWITLALTNAETDYALPFSFSSKVIFEYTPWKAVGITFLLVDLICSFYGFLQWYLNLYVGKKIGLVVTLFSALLVIRVRYFPGWVMYLTPAGWADLSNLSEYTSHGISLEKAVTILTIGLLFLVILVFHKTTHSDFVK